MDVDEDCQILLPCYNLIEKTDLDTLISNGFCTHCKNKHDINEEYIENNVLNEMTITKIYNRFHDSFKRLKEIIQDPGADAQTYIENIKYDIDIRIESIKIELDEIRDDMFNSLNNWKNKLENRAKKFIIEEKDECKKIEDFYETTSNMMSNFNENCQNLIENAEKILESHNKTSELLTNIKSINSALTFKSNEKWRAIHDIIGKFDGEILFGKRLKEKPLQKIYIGSEIRNGTNITSMNDIAVYTGDANGNLSQLDQNLQFINSINSIDKIRFSFPGGLSTDNQDKIYFCNTIQNKVYTLDKYLKRVINCFGKFGKGQEEFDNPKEVLYCNGCLFVLDSNNYRIQKFTETGVYISTIYLYKSIDGSDKLNNPSKMAIMDDVIGVLDESKYIYLYDFNGKLIQVLDLSDYGYVQSFCFVNDYLIVHSAYGYLLAFEKGLDGKFEKYFVREHDDLKEFSEGMTYFNGKLIILLGFDNCLVVI